ncbi:MAG: hypothetical protein DHS20C13_08800 [Thermodesulfobacteriota bacterium]|nr:MAG: hypothetical protein DHS20C13_08800 [Thermodesulfobacteriota bacterium]
MADSKLPIEVELVYELMPCNAMRVAQEPKNELHSCSYFRKWGTYHSYDYKIDGAPAEEGIIQESVYRGRAPLLPEMVSGCRKSPIFAIGINPNIPGWWSTKRSSVYPLFDDYKQYAHYFRYRSTNKLEIPKSSYEKFGGDDHDTPFTDFELDVPENSDGEKVIPLQLQPVTMYETYQNLIDSLAKEMKWDDHELKVGEDLAYGNMVACPSAKWITRRDRKNRTMPPMTREERDGIVSECFKEREYFLRQLFQSLPKVILVFSSSTSRAFIQEMEGLFVGRREDIPSTSDRMDDLMAKEVKLRYGKSGGENLEARVIFAPHITGDPRNYGPAEKLVINQLVEEADNGNLEYNNETKHLKRPKGLCDFCPMLEIGDCDYKDELTPITDRPGLAAEPDELTKILEEKRTQLDLLEEFKKLKSSDNNWDLIDETEDAPEFPADDKSCVEDSKLRLFSAPQLFADEIDQDVGPTYILKGRVVTMDQRGTVLENGQVLISKGEIIKLLDTSDQIPSEYEHAPIIDTQGTIYPGLIDLHNHFAYNALPLWKVPKKYMNRSQWPRHDEYKTGVSRPMKRVLAKYSPSSKAIVRYVEAKALLGGTTTGQGMRTQVRGGGSLFKGAMRNVEESNDGRLPEARTRVPDLHASEDRIEAFRRTLEETSEKGAAYFYHLSEGIDDSAHRHFENLKNYDLIKESLVGIHSLALKKEDFKLMAENGASIVWSPFSNLLLYGSTLNLSDVKESGVRLCLGCDWSPTGSKSLLQELKVASYINDKQGKVFTDEELIRFITSEAANITGWSRHLGSIKDGKFADLVVVDTLDSDPYKNLLMTKEENVKLVCVHGITRYGDMSLMTQTVPESIDKIEEWQLQNRSKGFYLFNDQSPINDVTFRGAQDLLERAMSDLAAFREEMEQGRVYLASLNLGEEQPEEFLIELDNDYDEDDPLMDLDTAGEPEFFLDDDAMDNYIPFDGPVAHDDEYIKRILSQDNLPSDLKDFLKNALK